MMRAAVLINSRTCACSSQSSRISKLLLVEQTSQKKHNLFCFQSCCFEIVCINCQIKTVQLAFCVLCYCIHQMSWNYPLSSFRSMQYIYSILVFSSSSCKCTLQMYIFTQGNVHFLCQISKITELSKPLSMNCYIMIGCDIFRAALTQNLYASCRYTVCNLWK